MVAIYIIHTMFISLGKTRTDGTLTSGLGDRAMNTAPETTLNTANLPKETRQRASLQSQKRVRCG